VREGRSLLQWKTDLRIGGEVGVAALPAITRIGDDVAARPIGEIGRRLRRPLNNFRRDIGSRPRGQAAGDVQRLEEAFGDRIGLAAGQPPRARRGVETLDRYDVGDAEAGEGVTHIAFPDEAAQVRILGCQGFDRFALAAEGVADVVDQDRAGDLDFDRLRKGSLRHAVAGAGLEREHRVVAAGPASKRSTGRKSA